MQSTFEQSPVINSPFRKPERHYILNEDGSPSGAIREGRRPSAYFVPIPPAKKKGKPKQAELALEGSGERVTQNDFINEIRGHVERWRELPAPQWSVTHETARLLLHWRAGEPQPPLFFCQIEAIETLIWLTEVAPKQRPEIRKRLEQFNAEANPELFRIALKMATGSGKTTVMAMLIAWQAVNFARRPGAKLFSDAFLIVTPGITIKDRLRVLLPSDPQNYYETRNLIPRDMLDDVRKARVVITNFHAFKLREKLQAPKLTKQILQGRDQALSTTETEGEMIRRVCPELMARKNIVVINDEAHHCYRHKAGEAEEQRVSADEREEAKKNEEAARVWISGLEAIKRKLGLRAIYDLSATPFFLRGSGYQEGTLFGWVVSDFSLMDAIESGIVKIPRVPVSDDQVGNLMPVYRDLYKHIRGDLPKKGRAKQKHESLDPDDLPKELTGALNALYGHYLKIFEQWKANAVGREPVFIVVCNNTSTSKLVYDHIAGYERTESGQKVLVDGKLELFRNVANGRWLHRPRTLLIDSEQLDSGEALTPEFKKIAAREIDEFKAELRARFPHRDVEKITDEDLLREVMNTVGKPGRLGEHVRCVVSVSMLTEGWDANTVTHILGVRAFGTQLLCEQVVGRALRRVNYDADDAGMFEPEYADVLGVPFTFVASHKIAAPRPPKPLTRVYALPERESLEIRFPRVVGYRVTLPSERLKVDFGDDSRLVISPDDIPTRAENEGIVGEGVTLTLEEIGKRRLREVEFYVAGHALRSRFRDDEGNLKPYLFPQLLRITREWLGGGYLVCKGDTCPQYLLWRHFADLAVDRIYRAVTGGIQGEERLRPIIDSYNAWGSSRYVDLTTSKSTLWTTGADRCQVNYVVYDSEWEANFCEQIERMPEVQAYVKNHALGFEVPYLHQGEERRYRPDFILKIASSADDPLHLIVEIKGYRQGDAQAKADTMRSLWIPAVNNHGALGRWAFWKSATSTTRPRKSERTSIASPSSRPPSSRRKGMARERTGSGGKRVETFTHAQAKRWNIPTAELQSLVREEEAAPRKTEYPRKYNPDEHPEMYARNPDLDPQLVWRGKDEQDRHPLTVDTVPIYVQEKIHPKAIIDDLRRVAQENVEPPMRDLFADFNGLPDTEAKYEFYAHAANWSNRMVLGDSLLVMNSLAEKERLRGQVQMIYIDPPYGIKFNSNWQVSASRRDVLDGKPDQISQEPEVIKTFRDTWTDGINTYLSYLRDRLVASQELLNESGSVFVQIGDENIHIVRSILDEVFSRENLVAQLVVQKTTSATSRFIPAINDYLLWYAKNIESLKFRALHLRKSAGGDGTRHYSSIFLEDGSRRPATPEERDGQVALPEGAKLYTASDLQSASVGRKKGEGAASWFQVTYRGRCFTPTDKSR